MSNLESVSANQDLWIELNDENAQTISGGAKEVFTIENPTDYDGIYYIDGKDYRHKPDEAWTYTVYKGGRISFDKDGRDGVESQKKYNLSNGHTYAFQYNTSTSDRYDIDLYKIS
jgi:hypothetical protein